MRLFLSLILLSAIATTSSTADGVSDVPYYRQYDNAERGGSACNITSVAMMVDYFGIALDSADKTRTPDKIYDRFGIKYNPEELAAIFNIIAREANANVRDTFYERGTIEQLRQELAQGNPVIVHGWFTKPGHIMVVTGFDGENYIVNDPAGRWNLKKWGADSYDISVSGEGIRYPAEAFEYAINDNGTGDDLWLHVFEPFEPAAKQAD